MFPKELNFSVRELGIVMHACNLNIWEVEKENEEFESIKQV